MDSPRLCPFHSRALASFGLLALVALGPLGCPQDDVSEGNETGGACGLPGDLVISEIVANVDGADAGLEWLEIYNASGGTIDLEGLTLTYEKIDGSGHKEHVIARSVEIPAGGYVVVGSMLDELAAGAALVDYGYGGELGELGNMGGYLAIGCDDVIDEVYYEEVSDTASRTLDGSQAPDAVANDDLASWCDSRTELDGGFAATPQATNDVCGGASTCGDGVEIIHPAVGELVITEILPNPDIVGDDVGEWFEIHSLAAAPFHLNGVDIGKSIEDDAEETIADAECIVIEPGQYALVAADADAMINGGLPPEAIVWESGVSLTNNDGSLWLGVGGELLDAFGWGSAGAGESIQLDPDFFDPGLNDDLANWCDGTEPYGDGDLGTPGAANLQCLIPPPEGQCYEDGELRDITPVEIGDLEITELMANPDVVDDGDGEWFEVLVKGAGDLNGLQIGKAGGVEHTVDFGDAPAFASDACITASPGDYVVFAHSADPLVNGGLPQVDVVFDMALNNSGSDVFIGFADIVGDQATWTSVTAGQSYSKDPLGMWCDGVGVYGDGDQGTPGEANPPCGGGNPDACIDPDNMLMRMLNPPSMGDFSISEVMPDPSGAPDATGEWFELHASAAFDLNGVQIGKTDVVNHTVSSDMCLEIDADAYVVLARSDIDNCDLPNIDYVYADFSLNNSNGNLQVGHGDVVFDEYSWASSSAGAADSYDMMSMMWCDAVTPYGCGDLGTPGDPNPPCDGQPMGDQCMDGMMPRDIVVPSPGDLVISEFMANPDVVADASGEWFEVRALASFDLNGLELGRLFMDGPLDTVDAVDCIALNPGDTALLARNGDVMTNGGLPLVDFVFGFGLTNSNSALHVAAAGVLLDEITWTSVATGSSTSLDPLSYDPDLNDTANNDGVIWCYAATPFGDGDNGSPGADNPSCN